MSQDQRTYTRASTASLIGLATQLLLMLLIMMIGFYAGSKAILAVAFYLVPGLWIWSLLWVIYHQHKLERSEALQAAQLADSDARSAALFEEAGDQLAQSRRRLENLYKWAMPITSGLTALYFIGVGTLLLVLNRGALLNESLTTSPINEDVNISLVGLLLLVGGLGGFLVARYVAGMTRVDSWQALRGGASTLIGNVFLGIIPLIFACVAIFFPGTNEAFVYLALILPVVMIVLGIEIVLGLVFGFYRPRKPGDFVRPAFDSRLLGWLTRPESIGKIFSETINYQFGFEVSKSWFMRLLSKALFPLFAACLLMVIGMTSVVIVEPHQQAIVTFNGSFVRVADPGISFKAPWPFARAEKFDVNRVHSIRLGSRSHIDDDFHIENAILWTSAHVPEGATEQMLITAPPPGTGADGETDSVLGERIGADIEIKFRISNLRQYAGIDDSETGSVDPETLLMAISQHEVTRYFATHDTDSLLSSGRATAGSELQAAIQAGLDNYSVGIEVVFVSVSGVHPPQEVADDYHARINALQEAQTARERARQEADMVYAAVAGDRERATRLGELITRHIGIEAQLQDLDDAADPAVRAELEQEKALLYVAIEQLMIESGGQVGQRLAEARSTRWSTSLGAEARALRLEAEQEAFELAPVYYPVSRYLDTLVIALADRHKTVYGPHPDAPTPEIVLDLPTGGSVPGVSLP